MNDRTISILWGDSIDPNTTQIDLVYSAYYSSAANIATVPEMLANGKVIAGAVKAGTTVSGLRNATTYYFNVIVQDLQGNQSAYTMQSAKTFSSLYMFATDLVIGTAVGGRAGATATCQAKQQAAYANLNCPNIVAFISVNTTDDILSLKIPWTTTVVAAPTRDVFLPQLQGLGTYQLTKTLIDVGVLSGASAPTENFWSGSYFDGTFASQVDECAGFTGSSGGMAYAGAGLFTYATWVGDGADYCYKAHPLLCLCWAQ